MEKQSLFPVVVPLDSTPNNESGSSLFPIDTKESASTANDSSFSRDWLQIKSFPSHEIDVNTIGQNELRTFKSKSGNKRKKKHKELKNKKQRSSEAVKPSLQEYRKDIAVANYSKKIFIEDVGLKPEHAFRVDRNSDQTQLCFTSMYHQHVPKYKKIHVCLGLQRHLKKKANKPYRYYSLLKDKSLFKSAGNSEIQLSKYLTEEGKFRKTTFKLSDYIPLQISIQEVGVANFLKESHASKELNPLGIYDGKTVEYLSGSGGLEHDSTVNQEENLDIQIKTKLFNEELRKNPKNVNKWLEYIDFQDFTFFNQTEKGSYKSRNLKLSIPLLEKKVAIIDKALKDNPGNVSLLMLKLKLCRNLWEKVKLKKEWNKLLFSHPNNVELWKTYLYFLQTYFPTFSARSISSEYYKCFKKLKQIVQGQFLSHLKPVGLEKVMIDIISSYCWFMMQSGYRELAIGISQAIIEFNMFPPAVKSVDLESVFEPFWDSRLPRFGEYGAQGWKNSISHKEDVQDYNPLEKEVEDKIFDLSESCREKHNTWIQMEMVRENSYWLPYEHNGDEASEDPDREVSSDQVLPFLFNVGSSENRMHLLSNFLLLLGVPPLSCSMTVLLTQQSIDQVKMESFPCWLLMTDLVLPGSSLSSLLKSLPSYGPQILPVIEGVFLLEDTFCGTSLEKRYSLFIREVFQQSLVLFDEPHRSYIILWWFRMELYLFKHFGGDAGIQTLEYKAKLRKWAKKVLKEQASRSNSLLFLEYGRLERLIGNHSEAKKILFTTLGLAAPDQLWSFILYLVEAYCDIIEHRSDFESKIEVKDELIWCLCCVAVNDKYSPYTDPVPPLMLLRARKVFQNMFNSIPTPHASTPLTDPFMTVSPPRSVAIQVCYAWLQYLTKGFSPATVIFETAIDFLAEYGWGDTPTQKSISWGDHCKEQLYYYYIQFLLFHMKVTPCSRETIRSVVVRALAHYPANGHFLSLLTQLEVACVIKGRLQRYFVTRLADSYPPESVYSVLGEVSHYQKLLTYVGDQSEVIGDAFLKTGHINKIINSMQRALSCDRCQSCVLLWRLYLFMLYYFDKKKMILPTFYEALQQCPWAKAIYVDTARYVPQKLNELITLMGEKDIRVRMPLEELNVLIEEKLVPATEDLSSESNSDHDADTDEEAQSSISSLETDDTSDSKHNFSGSKSLHSEDELQSDPSDKDDPEDLIGPLPPTTL